MAKLSLEDADRILAKLGIVMSEIRLMKLQWRCQALADECGRLLGHASHDSL